MKNKEIIELSDKELSARISDERNTVNKMKFTHAVSPIENPNKIKESKKLIARLLTEKNRRAKSNVQ